MRAVVQLIPFIITVLKISSRSFNQLNERPIIVFHLNMVLNNGPKVHNSADHGSDRGPQNPKSQNQNLTTPVFNLVVSKPTHSLRKTFSELWKVQFCRNSICPDHDLAYITHSAVSGWKLPVLVWSRVERTKLRHRRRWVPEWTLSERCYLHRPGMFCTSRVHFSTLEGIS